MSRYVPLLITSDFFVDLTVNGASLPEFPPEMLVEHMKAWDRYIARNSEQAMSNKKMGKLVAFVRLRRSFGALLQGRLEGAIADCDWVIEQNEEEHVVQTAHLLRAYVLGEAGEAGDGSQYELALQEWDQVITFCEQCVASHPASRNALGILYLERAILHAERSHFAHAVEDCNQALQCGVQTATLFSVRGLARGYLGESMQGLEDCTHAIQIKATADCYLRRAWLLSRLERFDEAYVDFEHARALVPESDDIEKALTVVRLRALCQWTRHSSVHERKPREGHS